MSPPHRLELERGKSAPGVTNGIAVCLQALRQYDLVTKWHTIVLHAHRLHSFQQGTLREGRSYWPGQLVTSPNGSVVGFLLVSKQLCRDFHPFGTLYSSKLCAIILLGVKELCKSIVKYKLAKEIQHFWEVNLDLIVAVSLKV